MLHLVVLKLRKYQGCWRLLWVNSFEDSVSTFWLKINIVNQWQIPNINGACNNDIVSYARQISVSHPRLHQHFPSIHNLQESWRKFREGRINMKYNPQGFTREGCWGAVTSSRDVINHGSFDAAACSCNRESGSSSPCLLVLWFLVFLRLLVLPFIKKEKIRFPLFVYYICFCLTLFCVAICLLNIEVLRI